MLEHQLEIQCHKVNTTTTHFINHHPLYYIYDEIYTARQLSPIISCYYKEQHSSRILL